MIDDRMFEEYFFGAYPGFVTAEKILTLFAVQPSFESVTGVDEAAFVSLESQ
jgi:hypothetical protein